MVFWTFLHPPGYQYYHYNHYNHYNHNWNSIGPSVASSALSRHIWSIESLPNDFRQLQDLRIVFPHFVGTARCLPKPKTASCNQVSVWPTAVEILKSCDFFQKKSDMRSDFCRTFGSKGIFWWNGYTIMDPRTLSHSPQPCCKKPGPGFWSVDPWYTSQCHSPSLPPQRSRKPTSPQGWVVTLWWKDIQNLGMPNISHSIQGT